MANNYTCDGQESLMDIVTSLIANPQTPELMQPAYRSLNHPTKDPQTTAMCRVAAGDARNDSNGFQCFTMRIRIIGTVGKQLVKTITRVTHFTFDRGNIIDQFQQLGHVMLIRRRGVRDNGNPFAVGQHMMFGARFSPVYRARAGLFAPPTARIVALSTAHRVKSISSAFRRQSKRVWWIAVQTPAFCQSCKRLQHVMPEPQPISWGNISQGIPEVKTKRMPVRHLRFSNGFLPGFLFRRFLTGMWGSIQFHSSSVSSGLAMIMPPCIKVILSNRCKYYSILLGALNKKPDPFSPGWRIN